MNLQTAFAEAISPRAKREGQRLYYLRAVQIVTLGLIDLAAEVRDGEVQDVSFHIDKSQLHVACTCKHFQFNGSCEHIWAVMIAADARQFARGQNLQVLIEDVAPEDIVPEDKFGPLRAFKPKSSTPKPDAWKHQLNAVLSTLQLATPKLAIGEAERRLVFVVDLATSASSKSLNVEIQVQSRKLNGEWSKPKAENFQRSDSVLMSDPIALQAYDLLHSVKPDSGYHYYSTSSIRYRLAGPMVETALSIIAVPERLFLRRQPQHDLEPLTPDLAPPWQVEVSLTKDEARGKLVFAASLRRGEERLKPGETTLLLENAVIWNGRIAPVIRSEAFAWVTAMRTRPKIEVPLEQSQEFVQELLERPIAPGLVLPEDLKPEEVFGVPKPQVVVKPFKPPYSYNPKPRLTVDLSFHYGEKEVPAAPFTRTTYDRETRKLYVRDLTAEQAAHEMLRVLGVRQQYEAGQHWPLLDSSKLPKLVRELVAAGWLVKAEGKLYRQASSFSMDVKSNVDWFDLNATANFEGTSVPLPRLLEALRKGDSTVLLDDGSHGMLPEEWMQKWGFLARMGTIEGDSVRFNRAQVGVLDALLASRPEVTFDQQFDKARSQIKKFSGVSAVDPPKEFQGQLREYQREGLGWMQFLRKFGFGGCLADDMGLGKTVQVLALLAGLKKGTALVVVPRSLVFNWKQEAARFAPGLKVLDHTGLGRDRTGANFKDHDLVLTTYGTLRNDINAFSTTRFDTCILDESQAAKNSETDTAKAVRLIQANHRLALSGTPVENHLGELWSLFEFLNPGMLGHSGLFGYGPGSARNADPEMRQLLAQALRPYILRRTKDQVAKDLPEKTEQTIYCDLDGEQRQLYDELREHYRVALLSKVNEFGIKRNKIQVLEALLRLRQASCHPGLIDKKRAEQSSAKLEVLLPQLEELAEEGHKALVFSQFTSLLAIVKKRLDKLGVTYEYLDGKTRDRAARVDRFQTDPDCKLFLVSLKAGGVGLNLTAAEYVFLLDPWWNPAVEAQAIDRSHRIGQTKPVFAYRIIAKNTVEEKVLKLQESKRDLANAILGGEGRLITDLSREDLELLLS